MSGKMAEGHRIGSRVRASKRWEEGGVAFG